MKFKTLCLFLVATAIISCKDDSSERFIEQQKEAKKKEVIFNSINQGWVFSPPQMQANVQSKVNQWMEWRTFLTEINQKPKSSIGAFQKKASALSKKVVELNNNIPQQFNKPQVKSRITVLITKVKALDLFIHLNQIPDTKVLQYVKDINENIGSLQMQMEEIVKRSQIPREAGEPDFLQMKDTSRAIPTAIDVEGTKTSNLFQKK